MTKDDLISRQPETHDKCTETHSCDCISRQAAIDAINNIMPTKEGFYEPSEVFCELMQLPSVQPEIIRCKECKHWREGTAFSYCDKLHGMGVLDALDYMTAEDDYCSMAEREADERQT